MLLDRLMRVVELLLRLTGVRRKAFRLADGLELSYIEAGAKPGRQTIVLLHGLGTSNLSWGRVIGRLRHRFHVVAPDLPGFGRSRLPAGKEHASVTDHGNALAEFLEHVPFATPVILVGQSMGGWLAVKAARRVPDRVSHLVLVNSAGVLYPGIEELQHIVTPSTKEEVFAFWKRMWHRVPAYYGLFWKDAASHMATANVRKFLESLQEGDFVNEDLALVKSPVTIIWGTEDRFIPAFTVDMMLEKLPVARVVWIPRCGHIPALEAPAEFVRVLGAVADSVREAGAPAPTPS